MDNSNDNFKALLRFEGEAIIRLENGQLKLIGMPFDPRHKIISKINAGHCGQVEIDALDGLPVFDEETLDPNRDSVLFVVPRIGRMK